jgi:hypothetical protein
MTASLGRTVLSLLAVLACGYAAWGRERMAHAGATEEEVALDLPGDQFVAADLTTTRAITVRARPEDVWPWIAQLGQGRGGFYSYDALENLVGCNVHSADRIVPAWQSVVVGDEVMLAPEVALSVAAVDPGRALVLRGGIPMGRVPAPYDFTWAFIVEAQAGGTTRLVVRERYEYLSWWAPTVVEPASLISFFMSRAMVHGVAERAERACSVA